jgi:hypothetical protein
MKRPIINAIAAAVSFTSVTETLGSYHLICQKREIVSRKRSLLAFDGVVAPSAYRPLNRTIYKP